QRAVLTAVLHHDQPHAHNHQRQPEEPPREQVGDLAGHEVDAGRAVPRQTDQQHPDADAGQPQLATQLGPRSPHEIDSLLTVRVRAPSRSRDSILKAQPSISPTSSSASTERITMSWSYPSPSTV